MKSFVTFLFGLILFAQPGSAQTNVPMLNSDPSSREVLFLDFDGHYMVGTSWNITGPITLGPANLSVDQITEVFNRIAEDYRPFKINVTTDSTRYAGALDTARMRVLFTVTSSWYGDAAGGVAYINSFKWGDNSPCFVFTALLHYNIKNISEAGSHEAGHTLGLRHQSAYDQNCNLLNEYNYGLGTGITSWAPIMGVGYSRNTTTWFNGPIPIGCTNTQQDLDVIRRRVALKDDDYEESFLQATPVTFVNNRQTVQGTIGQPTDKDMFELSFTGRKRLTLNVAPGNIGQADVGSNLDVQVQLFDSRRNLIATINPPDILTASTDTILNEGIYYALVDGVGNSTIPNDYGSLGRYVMQAQLADVTPLPLHKLELQGGTTGNSHRLNWVIEADEAVVSQTLEASANGAGFVAIANVDANSRSFTRAAEGLIQYRLLVKFDNGRNYYSNNISLRNEVVSKPKLLVTSVHTSIQVNSPSVYQYSITDLGGRLLAEGRITAGSTHVPLPALKAGAYLIRFTNNTQSFVDKFIKQ